MPMLKERKLVLEKRDIQTLLNKDEERKQRYIDRHKKKDWNDSQTAGAWPKGIPWNKPSMREVKKIWKRNLLLEINLRNKFLKQMKESFLFYEM